VLSDLFRERKDFVLDRVQYCVNPLDGTTDPPGYDRGGCGSVSTENCTIGQNGHWKYCRNMIRLPHLPLETSCKPLNPENFYQGLKKPAKRIPQEMAVVQYNGGFYQLPQLNSK